MQEMTFKAMADQPINEEFRSRMRIGFRGSFVDIIIIILFNCFPSRITSERLHYHFPFKRKFSSSGSHKRELRASISSWKNVSTWWQQQQLVSLSTANGMSMLSAHFVKRW